MSLADADKTVAWKYRTRVGTAKIAAGIELWRSFWVSDISSAAAIEITSMPISDEVMIGFYHLADDTNVYIKERWNHPGEMLDDLMEPTVYRLRAESKSIQLENTIRAPPQPYLRSPPERSIQYACPHCPALFRRRYNRDRHIVTWHVEGDPV